MLICILTATLAHTAQAQTVIVAEGEKFTPVGEVNDKSWRIVPQDQSYGSHTYGGTWTTHGALIGVPADSVDAVATQTIHVPEAGRYRVWSRYQAPPYFTYLHRIEVVQNGKAIYSHVYGRSMTPRLWSFGASSGALWWTWGVDHDAAEAPQRFAELEAGPAELRLTSLPPEGLGGDRHIDFVVLTTEERDDYDGYRPRWVVTPFANEALAATKLYMRFQNTSAEPAQIGVTRRGHFNPDYGGATGSFPDEPVAPGAWSAWVNIGPFVRLVHNEGLWFSLKGAGETPVQFARDAEGRDVVGDVVAVADQAVNVPIDVTWNPEARVMTSRAHAERLIELSKTWRRGNGGVKPTRIRFYAEIRDSQPWFQQLKDTLGYNTNLPELYVRVKPDGIHYHAGGADDIRELAKGLGDKKESFHLVSLGHTGGLMWSGIDNPASTLAFMDWARAKGLGRAELGVPVDQANPVLNPTPRLMWYAGLYAEERRMAGFRAAAQAARESIGPQAVVSINQTTHHPAAAYLPIADWGRVFNKDDDSLGMFWAQDHLFTLPEPPQTISWILSQARSAVRWGGQPIHMYVMPHAPGQTPGNLRRNVLLSVGAGATYINNFWVAPQEEFTENYIAWGHDGSFRAASEAIFDSAEAERFAVGGAPRRAKVALVTGRATDFNETRLGVSKDFDPFTRDAANAASHINQTLCRKDQQMLYLALRHAQLDVDLITEDDIVDRDALAGYAVVYFAGEWIDDRIVPRLEAWVRQGGVLYAAAGMGHKNQFDEPEPAMLALLGLASVETRKNLIVIRPLLELPVAKPVGMITLSGGDGDGGEGASKPIPAIGMRQTLAPAGDTRVIGTWEDGSAAVTVRELEKGRVIAVGTLAGGTYLRPAVRVQPFPRGGHKHVYNPTDFDPDATRLALLGVREPGSAALAIQRQVECSEPLVEAWVLDHPEGTLVTLINWTNAPIASLNVRVRLPFAPSSARSVEAQAALPVEYADGVVTLTTTLNEADYILLPK